LKSRLDKVTRVCEAVGCDQEATEQIKINAGKYGTLVLGVCSKCTGKFQD
jgi:hypothetical protein